MWNAWHGARPPSTWGSLHREKQRFFNTFLHPEVISSSPPGLGAQMWPSPQAAPSLKYLKNRIQSKSLCVSFSIQPQPLWLWQLLSWKQVFIFNQRPHLLRSLPLHIISLQPPSGSVFREAKNAPSPSKLFSMEVSKNTPSASLVPRFITFSEECRVTAAQHLWASRQHTGWLCTSQLYAIRVSLRRTTKLRRGASESERCWWLLFYIPGVSSAQMALIWADIKTQWVGLIPVTFGQA